MSAEFFRPQTREDNKKSRESRRDGDRRTPEPVPLPRAVTDGFILYNRQGPAETDIKKKSEIVELDLGKTLVSSVRGGETFQKPSEKDTDNKRESVSDAPKDITAETLYGARNVEETKQDEPEAEEFPEASEVSKTDVVDFVLGDEFSSSADEAEPDTEADVRPKAIADFAKEELDRTEAEAAALTPDQEAASAAVATEREYLLLAQEQAAEVSEESTETEHRSIKDRLDAVFQQILERHDLQDVAAEPSEDDLVSLHDDAEIPIAGAAVLENTARFDGSETDSLDETDDTSVTHAAYAAASPYPGGGTYATAGSATYNAGSFANRGAAYAQANMAATAAYELHDPAEDKNNALGAALLALGVGLWLGNRHGRKKATREAEKRHKPVVERLQKTELQVQAVRSKMASHESRLARAEYEHVKNLRAAESRANAAEQRAAVNAQQVVQEHTGARTAEAAPAGQPLAARPQFEKLAESVPLAAAAGIAAAESSVPRAADMVPAAERPVAKPVEQVPSMPPGLREHPSENIGSPRFRVPEAPPPIMAMRQEAAVPNQKPVEAMNQEELLAVADTITVGGETVKQIFKRKELSDTSLRRVIAEYQRGGDVKRVLDVEKVNSSYERDPQLRNHAQQDDQIAAAGASPTAATMSHYQQPTLPSGMDEDAQLLPPSSMHPLLPAHEESSVPTGLVIANVVAFIVLAILFIVWLFIK